MKILEILTFAPSDEANAYDARPLNDPEGLQRISTAFTGPEFVVDPLRLKPGVAWPGASAPDTVSMPVMSPNIGRDTLGSVDAPTRNGVVQQSPASRRRITP